MELNLLSLRNNFAPTGMNLSVQMAQAVALHDTMITLLMCTHKQSFKLVTNAQEKIFNRNKVARVSKVIYVLLFLTNIIYAGFFFFSFSFDSLRALKKRKQLKMIRVKKGKAKTKKFSFPLMSQAAMFFLQNMGRCD